MKKNKIWSILAATAGSFAVLVSSQMVMRPFASMEIPENGYEVEGGVIGRYWKVRNNAGGF